MRRRNSSAVQDRSNNLSIVKRAWSRQLAAAISGALVLTFATTLAAQPLKRGHHFEGSEGAAGPRVREVFPAIAVTPGQPSSKPAQEPQREKIHPLLSPLLDRQSTEIVEVIIGFDDGVSIPAMPRQLGNESPDSATNAASRERTKQLIIGVVAKREAKSVGRRERLRREFDVDVVETFWLTGAWLAHMPASRIRALAALPEVTSVEPTGIGLPPPAYRGRALINSDWFAVTYGWNIFFPFSEVIVALLDTGVRATHSMFNNPDVIRIWRDCVNGTSNNCATGTNLNPNDTSGHGTRSAGVISGNGGPLGGDYRGVSTFTIDSYKVYLGNNLNEPAVLRAFSAAVAEGAWVIAAEMQHPSTFTGSIAAAAEAAFDAGVTVVAADGNSNVVSVVASPANAHRVLGIGAVDSETGVTQTYAVYGPTTDNRIKPDVQLPSEFLTTAGNQNDTDSMISAGQAPRRLGQLVRQRFCIGGTAIRLRSASILSPGCRTLIQDQITQR